MYIFVCFCFSHNIQSSLLLRRHFVMLTFYYESLWREDINWEFAYNFRKYAVF